MKSEFKIESKTQRICGVGISQRVSKDGIATYQLRKARPRKAGQPRKSEFSMTWKNTMNLSGKKLETALNEQIKLFLKAYEENISGVSIKAKDILFWEYAAHVMKIKEAQGLKKSTLAGYTLLLVRLNERFGNIPIKNISTADLNAYYAELKATKVDRSTKAVCKVNLIELIKTHNITKVDIAKATGLSLPTIDACMGTRNKAANNIEYANAETITSAINILLNDTEKLSLLQQPKKKYMVSDLFDIIETTDTLSPKTIREYHRLLSTIFEYAVDEDLIDKNPTVKATPPKLKHNEAQFYDSEEIERIRECMELDIQTALAQNRKPNYKFRAILYLMMSTGCRRGEVAGLTWDCIDWENNLIYVRGNLLYTSIHGTYTDTLKTENSKRTLYLEPSTKVALLDYISQLADIKNKITWNDSDLIFVRDNGGPINPNSITRWCARIATRHNLPHIHPHAFRHTLASVMLSNKSNIIDVSRYLGHSKPSVTSDIYSHVLKNANIELGRDISKVIMGNVETP